MHMTTIDSLTLVSGPGKRRDHTACLMSAARILAGEAAEADIRSDNCARVCPVVRRFAIGVNDWRGWAGNEERTAFLRPLTPLLLDTIGSRDVQRKRAFIAADFACRFVAGIALEAPGRRDLADRARAIPEIIDIVGAGVARDEMRKIAYAAAATAYADSAAAADSAATAADYAADYAATATATAADYAATAADYAATAAADAATAAAAAARIKLRDGLIDTLKRMCAVTE